MPGMNERKRHMRGETKTARGDYGTKGYMGVTDATGKTFISGASNDVITMNGSTKGGLAGSIVKVTAMASAKYAVEGIILGSGTLVTPFADA